MNPCSCIYCGKYIKISDFDEGLADKSYTPDSEYTEERFDFWHTACKKDGEA